MTRCKKITEYRVSWIDDRGDSANCDHHKTAQEAEAHALPLIPGTVAWCVERVRRTGRLMHGGDPENGRDYTWDIDSEDVIAYGGDRDALSAGGWIS